MRIEFTYSFDIEDPSIKSLLRCFIPTVRVVFQELCVRVILLFAEQYKAKLSTILNSPLIWKSRTGNRVTNIHTILGKITLPMPQVQRKDTGQKIYLTRFILGMDRYRRIPMVCREIFARLGASFPYRVGMSIVNFFADGLFGLASLHRAVKEVSGDVKALWSIQANQSHEFVADGTGIPIQTRGKRGGELKILSQRQKDGSLRIVGTTIGDWKRGWDTLFAGLKKTFGRFRTPVSIVTDGDRGIVIAFREVLPSRLKLWAQRCTWHLPRELKYMLWKDGSSVRGHDKKKKALGKEALKKLYKIMNDVRALPSMEQDQRKIASRKARKGIIDLATWCFGHGLLHSSSLLTRVYQERGFSAAENGILTTTTSKQERMMGTLNKRINVGGTWSDEGAEAVAILRLAGYYNNWKPSVWFGEKKYKV